MQKIIIIKNTENNAKKEAATSPAADSISKGSQAFTTEVVFLIKNVYGVVGFGENVA